MIRGRWWSPQTAGFIAAGALAGSVAWVLGPRAALALAAGLGTAGGLVVLTWLRARIRALSAETARLRVPQRELQSTLDRRLPGLEKQLRAELSAAEKRLLAAHGATEKRMLAEISTVERRLRTGGSGDLAALEKRLRDIPFQPEVR